MSFQSSTALCSAKARRPPIHVIICNDHRTGLQRSNLPMLTRLNATGFLGPSNRRPYPVPLVPHQLIATKTPVDPEQPPNFTYRDDRTPLTTQSWKTWATDREKDEWIVSVGSVLENGWGDHQYVHSLKLGQKPTICRHVAMRPPKVYEFSSGYNTSFSQERYYIGESYFDQRHMAVSPFTMSGPLY